MAIRLKELEERLAALEAETGGYAPYGEEAYAPYGEEAYAPYGEEAYAPYEEEMVGALEEAFGGMSEEEIEAFSDTLEALETGQLQFEDLTPEEMNWLGNAFRKASKWVKRAKRYVRHAKPYWKKYKEISRYFPWEEEMAARRIPIPIGPRCRCPPGYHTAPVGYRCVRMLRPRPPALRK